MELQQELQTTQQFLLSSPFLLLLHELIGFGLLCAQFEFWCNATRIANCASSFFGHRHLHLLLLVVVLVLQR